MDRQRRRKPEVTRLMWGAVGGVLVVAGSAVVAGTPASAQEAPATVTAVADCVSGDPNVTGGNIVVTLVDNAPYRYNVIIGGTVVDANIPDGSGNGNTYEPYADGAYLVAVDWIALDGDQPLEVPERIFSQTVTVDCVADVPTAAAPTTVAPTTAAPAVAAPTTTPPATLPATGDSSTTIAILGGLSLLAGAGLLLARRRPRQA
jgi:LPXTG-motif cell wall-anchored protein